LIIATIIAPHAALFTPIATPVNLMVGTGAPDVRFEVGYGSFTSFRARDVDFRFTLNTGHFSASQRTVETGQLRS
jgi:hypothetical protein